MDGIEASHQVSGETPGFQSLRSLRRQVVDLFLDAIQSRVVAGHAGKLDPGRGGKTRKVWWRTGNSHFRQHAVGREDAEWLPWGTAGLTEIVGRHGAER